MTVCKIISSSLFFLLFHDPPLQTVTSTAVAAASVVAVAVEMEEEDASIRLIVVFYLAS